MDFPTIVIALLGLILLGLALNSGIKWLRKKKLKNDISNFLKDLNTLKEELGKFQNHSNPINRIASFFTETSHWHDRMERIIGLMDRCEKLGTYPQTRTNLVKLMWRIENAGRVDWGMNRTTAGQTVTEKNVYLGVLCGLDTKTVLHLRKNRSRLEAERHPDVTIEGESASVWQVYENEARSFMDHNVKEIVNMITILRASFSQES